MSVPISVFVIMAMFMRPILIHMIVMGVALMGVTLVTLMGVTLVTLMGVTLVTLLGLILIGSAMRVVVFMFHRLHVPLMLECLHPPQPREENACP
jgi:hypothetical protein